jgi:hypothetical protein
VGAPELNLAAIENPTRNRIERRANQNRCEADSTELNRYFSRDIRSPL